MLDNRLAPPGVVAPTPPGGSVAMAERPGLPDPTRPQVADWFGSLPDELMRAAAVAPASIAISDRYGDWSYAAVDRAACAVAAELARRGVTKGDTVAVVPERAGALVWALLGIMRLGAVFCIVDPSHPSSRVRASLQAVSPTVVVVAAPPEIARASEWLDHDQLARVLELPPTPADVCARGHEHVPHQRCGAATSVSPDDVAYIALTSGSTGAPRAIVGTHRPLSHFFWWYRNTFDFGTDDRFSAISGLGHDPLLRDLFTPLLVGARLCFPSQLAVTSADLATWVSETGITVMHGTPSHMNLLSSSVSVLRRSSSQWLSSLRYFFSGGDALTTQGLAELYATAPNVRVVNFYGATETPQAIAWFDVGKQTDSAWQSGAIPNPVPVGRGIDGVQLLVLDAALDASATGVEGEICVRTPYLARGYLNEPELTAAKFVPDPFVPTSPARLYRTGDLGIMGPDGMVQFSRRLGTMAKVRGFRVEPGDVEQALRRGSDIRQCAVLVEEDAYGESKLVAYVVGRAGAPRSEAAVRAQLSSLLPSYMVPSALVWLAALPLTPSGKVDRLALGKASAQRCPPGQRSDAPRTSTERRLAMVWRELLGVERVGLQDDFFSLGGQSLIAVQLFVRIEQLWGLRLPLATLLRASTLASLAEAIDNPEHGTEWFSLVPLQPLGERVPLYCVHGLFGDVLAFADLARALGAGQPTFGLQARGLDGIQHPSDRVETMAAAYVDEIRRNQPAGPYRLLGFSSGGLVAYEMARQLTRMGHQVAFVGVLDEPIRDDSSARTPLRPGLLLENAIANIPYWAESLRRSPWDERAKLVRDRWRMLGLAGKRGLQSALHAPVAPASDDCQFERYIEPFMEMEDMAYVGSWPDYRRRLVKAQLRASRSYRPLPYDGSLTVFRARRQPLWRRFERDLGWSHLVRGRVDVVVVPGSHRRMIAPPYVYELAERLRGCLDSDGADRARPA